MRFVIRSLFSLCLVCGLSFLMTGCGGGPEDDMVGEYQQGPATLKITGDTMSLTAGPMTLAVNYKVTSADGNKVTVEQSVAGDERKINKTITTTDDGIEFDGGGEFRGKWKRK